MVDESQAGVLTHRTLFFQGPGRDNVLSQETLQEVKVDSGRSCEDSQQLEEGVNLASVLVHVCKHALGEPLGLHRLRATRGILLLHPGHQDYDPVVCNNLRR